MDDPFRHSLRWLETDRALGARIAGIGSTLVLVLWLLWAALFDVGLYITSDSGRIESEALVHDIRSPRSGRIAMFHAPLGSAIRAGDPLFELDGTALSLELKRLRAEHRAIKRRVEPLRAQIAAHAESLEIAGRAGKARRQETKTQQKAATVDADHADNRAMVLRGLASRGVVAHEQVEDAGVTASLRRLEARRWSQALTRMQEESGEDVAVGRAELERLEGLMQQLLGSLEIIETQIQRIEWERSELLVLAPISGIVGERTDAPPGTLVDEGASVVQIVPDGHVRVVAEFAPAASVGRVHPGQRGRLRVSGFPWTQFGTVPVEVQRVGNEPREGRIQVQLQVLDYDGPIPVQHGLTGAVELHAERTTPLNLAFRIAGRVLEGG